MELIGRKQVGRDLQLVGILLQNHAGYDLAVFHLEHVILKLGIDLRRRIDHLLQQFLALESLANLGQLGAKVDAVSGQLDDYHLVFNKMSRDHVGVGHANIQFRRGAVTEGVLYELASVEEIYKMDPFERAPWNYGREVVQIDHDEGSTWAWTYFANPAVIRTDLSPPLEYLDHLLAGREFLSGGYVEMLLAHRARLL